MDVPDPTMAQLKQRPLKREGLENRKDAIAKLMIEFKPFMEGGEYDKNCFDEYYTLMCGDIIREKARIGGRWAIAQCVFTRNMRDLIR